MSLAKQLKAAGVDKKLRRQVRDLELAHSDLLLAVQTLAGFASDLDGVSREFASADEAVAWLTS